MTNRFKLELFSENIMTNRHRNNYHGANRRRNAITLCSTIKSSTRLRHVEGRGRQDSEPSIKRLVFADRTYYIRTYYSYNIVANGTQNTSYIHNVCGAVLACDRPLNTIDPTAGNEPVCVCMCSRARGNGRLSPPKVFSPGEGLVGNRVRNFSHTTLCASRPRSRTDVPPLSLPTLTCN